MHICGYFFQFISGYCIIYSNMLFPGETMLSFKLKSNVIPFKLEAILQFSAASSICITQKVKYLIVVAVQQKEKK